MIIGLGLMTVNDYYQLEKMNGLQILQTCIQSVRNHTNLFLIILYCYDNFI